jgi:hypothetical protein
MSHTEIAIAFWDRGWGSGVKQISQPNPSFSSLPKILNAEMSFI